MSSSSRWRRLLTVPFYATTCFGVGCLLLRTGDRVSVSERERQSMKMTTLKKRERVRLFDGFLKI